MVKTDRKFYVTNLKSILRQNLRQQRLALSDGARAGMAAAFTDLFLRDIILPKEAVVAGYVAIRGEMDVMPLMGTLALHGHALALPQVVDLHSPLLFRRWSEGTDLVNGVLGIQTPDPATAPEVVPDVLLVPLLAFDAAGHRLGYGAGHYDRTIAGMKKRPLCIGVGYHFQKIDSLPYDAHDQKLDIAVTDKEIIRF